MKTAKEQKFFKILCDPLIPNQIPAGYVRRTDVIERHHNRAGKTPEDDDVCGFHFSMETLKDFINKIEAYNTLHTAKPCRQITGIRIWQARSLAFDSNHWTEDVLLTPTVTDNGKNSDIHAFAEGEDLKDAAGNLYILTSSRPCPNLCGTSGPKFFYKEAGTPTAKICP